MRALLRKNNAIRQITLIPGVNKYAEGSCLAQFGDTKVLCTATIENKVPPFLRNSGQGWVTAEYSMLPRATNIRTERERNKAAPNGRTIEISRLIGRVLRTCVNLAALGERQVIVDCDVLQADGGTRTTAITGGYVAMYLALAKLTKTYKSRECLLVNSVSAVSCGIVGEEMLLDLDFEEDSNAKVDANFVITGDGRLVEVQATAEKLPFTEEEFGELLELAKKGNMELCSLQKKALGIKDAPAAPEPEPETEAEKTEEEENFNAIDKQ